MKQLVLFVVFSAFTLCLSAQKVEIDGMCYSLITEKQRASVTFRGELEVALTEGSYSGDIVIPDEIEYDGTTYKVEGLYYAFTNCSNLTSVQLPSSLLAIGGYSFRNCTKLTSITIPPSVEVINSEAFKGCISLSTIDFPGNSALSEVGWNVFEDTPWYKQQPDGIVYTGSVAYRYKGNMPEKTSIELKDGTKGVASYAFAQCTGMEAIVVPNSTTYIGSGAFSDCKGLKSITILQDQMFYISDNALQGCNNLEKIITYNETPSNMFIFYTPTDLLTNCNNVTLYVPSGCKDAYIDANYGDYFAAIVEMDPSSITDITADRHSAIPYNLAGQALSGIQKGINIVNGKKILVK